jgi:hypothetical protein
VEREWEWGKRREHIESKKEALAKIDISPNEGSLLMLMWFDEVPLLLAFPVWLKLDG